MAPVLGALAVAYLVKSFAPEARGHGIPEVMDAIHYNKGIIRPVVAVIKSLASAISIGRGGSVGPRRPDYSDRLLVWLVFSCSAGNGPVLLCTAKLLATCVTLGSDASGGIFSPALFMGATLGGAYGFLLARLFPSARINAPALPWREWRD